MSEKTRQKKEGQNKNKNNRRMRSATKDPDDKIPGRKSGHTGKVKNSHKIDSVREGYSDRA